MKTNGEGFFHHWTSCASSYSVINAPFYPANRLFNISMLDDIMVQNVNIAIRLAETAVSAGGIATIGFHDRYWTDYNDGELWKEYIDAIAEIQGIYHYGFDEILDGMFD